MYRTIIRKVVEKQNVYYQQAKAGDLSQVCYRQQIHPDFGRQDQNGLGRLRLACYLLFCQVDDLPLVELLFEEELKDRRTNDFQGIGPRLEILTALLAQRNRDGRYDLLFRQAKNANFDCACGYNPALEVPNDLSALSLEDCVGLAVLLEEPELAGQLVQIWKAGVRKWDDDSCRNLLRWNQAIGDRSDHERLLTQKLRNAQQGGSRMSRLSAGHDLMRYYVEECRFAKAVEQLDRMRRDDLEQLGQSNLFRFVLEDCMDIILGGGQDAQAIWQWSKPWILGQKSWLHGNLYRKAVQAAWKLEDPEAQQLEQDYQQWRQSVRLD